jgi:hypothetical protein
MPDTFEEIKNYSVEYYAGGNSNYAFRAIVDLRRNDNSLFACLYFYRNPTAMPNVDDQAKLGRPYAWCYFPEEDFSRVLDLLRNEKPLYFRYITGTLNMGVITTSNEPVGEGERTTP